MVNHSSSSPLPLPPPPPLPPPASPPVVVPWSSSVTVFSSVSSSVVHDSCAPRMAAAARLCRLLPTGRKNVVAGLVVHFRLHVRQAQVVCVRVPATVHRRVQLAQNSQVNDEAVAQVLGNAVDEHLRKHTGTDPVCYIYSCSQIWMMSL